MSFNNLYTRISPRLRRVANRYKRFNLSIDKDDLYQEMSLHLWNNFKDGVPSGINDAYIIKGCEFHILNYLRLKKKKAVFLSMDEPINEQGLKLQDILVQDQAESACRKLEQRLVFEEIMNNGFTEREKQVLKHLLEGHTVRGVGEKLNISHVMVLKYKQRIIKKWNRKKPS